MIESREGAIYISPKEAVHVQEVASRLSETYPDLPKKAGGMAIIGVALDSSVGIAARGVDIPVSAAELLINQAESEIKSYETQQDRPASTIKRFGRRILDAISGPPTHVASSERVLPQLQAAVEQAKDSDGIHHARKLDGKKTSSVETTDPWQIAEDARNRKAKRDPSSTPVVQTY